MEADAHVPYFDQMDYDDMYDAPAAEARTVSRNKPGQGGDGGNECEGYYITQ